MILTRVKICGITQIEQAVAISQMRVDALGFILYPKSPRYIAPDKIKPIINALPPFTKTVGVFVNEPAEVIENIMKVAGLDVAQLSGDEPPETFQELTVKGVNWIKTVRIRKEEDLQQLSQSQYSNHYLLLDAWSKEAYGGTGKTLDWDRLNLLQDRSRIILAGGLNAENIATAIRKVRPYGVDLSSGVEISPGIKSISKVKALLDSIEAA